MQEAGGRGLRGSAFGRTPDSDIPERQTGPQIREIAEALSIPVIANGDVTRHPQKDCSKDRC